MRSYKNNNKRKFRINGDRNSTRGHDPQTLISNTNFQRKNHRNNNHNAARLVEKYSSLAREALSSGDKILSESYFQHSDHFIRVLNEKEKNQGISRTEKTKLDDKVSVEEKSKETDNNIGDKKIATS
jgi:hypothetical protein|tara:strand:- start:146 stop:526 length:381 start_codon:yes stop_codon:yes gene_type:complete